MSTTVVSAPGKVLIAGGYLVLDPAYTGIVVATSSRFYTVIRPSTAAHIRVRSPQFRDAVWAYSFRIDESSPSPIACVEEADAPSSKNKFVHLALQKTFQLALEVKGVSDLKQAFGTGLDIAILGDNDFYSQQDQLKKLALPRNVESLAKIPPFCPTGVAVADVSKTGLGSSAALITSLVTALLVHLAIIPASALADADADGAVPPRASLAARHLAHNVAQFVHCLAQGKIGSGFDVSAAVFGSQLYTRFSPSVIKPLVEDTTGNLPLYATLSSDNPAWDFSARPFKLPPHIRLLLADVHAGSNTPLLVSKVLRWREENSSAAHSLWTALDQLNTSLAQTLLRLCELHSINTAAYLEIIRWVSSLQALQWLADPNMEQHHTMCLEAFYEVHLLSEQIRAKMREMGKLSGVEIEPATQTKLLDDSVALAGVIAGGVPGAGGYDALWLLVCDPPGEIYGVRPLARVERLWGSYEGVAPLNAKESSARGVRVEQPEAVRGLQDVLQSAQ